MQATVAVLYQALPAPVIDGVRKDPKPGGYSDSGADIAYCLRTHGVSVVTPGPQARPDVALDWVFPDTVEGIAAAIGAGATVLWANTVLFSGHPLEAWVKRCAIVGQRPACQQAGDDKFATNVALREAGLPVASSVLVAADPRQGQLPLHALTAEALQARGLRFPLVVKPVRGRGSQGVSVAGNMPALQRALTALFDSGSFGDQAIVEAYLDGEELTVTVMAAPGGAAPYALPPVRRFNHRDGIAPYNGVVAVSTNSVALSADRRQTPAVQALLRACTSAFTQVRARAPIRIDCRADAAGNYLMFDLNMKPNMTGAGRPGREQQDSLSLIAMRAAGGDYFSLLQAMLEADWRDGQGAAEAATPQP